MTPLTPMKVTFLWIQISLLLLPSCTIRLGTPSGEQPYYTEYANAYNYDANTDQQYYPVTSDQNSQTEVLYGGSIVFDDKDRIRHVDNLILRDSHLTKSFRLTSDAPLYVNVARIEIVDQSDRPKPLPINSIIINVITSSREEHYKPLIQARATETAEKYGYEVVEQEARKYSLNENDLDDKLGKNQMQQKETPVAQGLLVISMTSPPRSDGNPELPKITARMNSKIVDLSTSKTIWESSRTIYAIRGVADGFQNDPENLVEKLSDAICRSIPDSEQKAINQQDEVN